MAKGWWENRVTAYGFNYGPMRVTRCSDNDGADHKPKYAALQIETQIQTVSVTCDAKGDVRIVRTFKNRQGEEILANDI